jgi:hypothetical protein
LGQFFTVQKVNIMQDQQITRKMTRALTERTKNLLKLNRHQLRWVVGLFTGHCHLKGHLCNLGLTDDSACERCLEKDESATHFLCDCEAIPYLRFHHLG